MDKKKLSEMAKNPDLIPGIYNYCDRWCERCAFTSRCLNHLSEQEEKREAGDRDKPDEMNQAFWDEIGKSILMTIEMLREMAEKEGIDLDAAMEDEEVKEEMARSEERREAAREHPCAKAAREYYRLVSKWFEEAKELWKEKKEDLISAARLSLPGRNPEVEALELSDVTEVISWYQHFISAKIHRALTGRAEDREAWPDDEQTGDDDGSAKIALIAIDRSIGAWAILNREFPEQEDRILVILVLLERLRRSLEAEFPNARSFIRPGFDE